MRYRSSGSKRLLVLRFDYNDKPMAIEPHTDADGDAEHRSRLARALATSGFEDRPVRLDQLKVA